MAKTYYLHTINGEPAEFVPHQKQLCFIGKYGAAGKLASSLRQIRREQAINRRQNPDISEGLTFGYVRVRIDD
jgi:hypothetical protein